MKQNSSLISRGAGLVALAALGYATNPVFGKMAYQAGANALTIGSMRFGVAAICLWAMVWLKRERASIALKRRLQLIVLGGLGTGLVALLYFSALEHIEASLATGLFYTFPAFVTVIGLIRGESITRNRVISLLLTAAGTWALLGSTVGKFTWGGASLILTSAMLYTAYMLAADKWAKGISPTVASAHVIGGGAIFYLVIVLVTGQPMPSAGAYVGGVGLALCSTVLGFTSFFAGMREIGPTQAAIISTLEPVFTALLAVLFLGDSLTPFQITGIALVVCGAMVAQVRSGRATELA